VWGSLRPRGERGAVAVLTACLLPILIGVAAIVIDIGMQRVTRTDLQALADVVAMDLAREIRGGRTQAELAAEGDFSDPSSAVSRSVARNPDVLGLNLDVDVDWGSWNGTSWNTATDPPTAVRVIAHAETDYAITSGNGEATRRAYAVASNSACYRLGTFLAAVRSGDSTVLGPLNYLLGVNLGLVSYQALADAEVTIAELAAAPTIGSPERLLTGTVTYDDLILATIDALSKQPGSNSAAISALQTLHAAAGPVGTIAVGDVLHVSPTDTAALDITLAVLDIIGSARLANGEHFIEVENINAGVPAVGFQFTGGIALISAAQLACGMPNSAESVARNAQLEGTLGITFANLPSLSVPNLATLQTSKASGSLDIDLASGVGRLVSPPEVRCGDGTSADPDGFSVSVQTDPASYRLTADLDITGEVKVSVLQDLGLGSLVTGLLGILLPTSKVSLDAHVRIELGTSAGPTATIASLSVPPNDVTPVETGTSAYLDPNSVVPTVTDVRIGGKTTPLSGVLPLTSAIVSALTTSGNQFVQKTLVPLVDNINNVVVGPVARMVGLRFGGADVYAVGAVCGQPALRG
jgi:hypothetical protein